VRPTLFPSPGSRATLEVRLHGRGGQGTVTAAELLAVAAFRDGLFAQAYPSFGSERMGAPVEAYCRIGTASIRTHEPVVEPDVLVILDRTLVHSVDLFSGLRSDGMVLVNTNRTLESLGLADLFPPGGELRVDRIPATEIGRRLVGRPAPNAAMLGALAAATGAVSLPSVMSAFRDRFPGPVGEANAAAAQAGYEVIVPRREPDRACTS
jgi:pyruvate ferredoxin oxidoreductase gamma subunit